MKDCNGVVIVFNPEVTSHLQEIKTWHDMFISEQSLQEKQCLLIAHHKPGSRAEEGQLSLGNINDYFEPFSELFLHYLCYPFTDLSIFDVASPLNKLQLIKSNLEEEPEDVRNAFIKYIGNVEKAMSENREREEMSIMM